jgi:hypothetical protein
MIRDLVSPDDFLGNYVIVVGTHTYHTNKIRAAATLKIEHGRITDVTKHGAAPEFNVSFNADTIRSRIEHELFDDDNGDFYYLLEDDNDEWLLESKGAKYIITDDVNLAKQYIIDRENTL